MKILITGARGNFATALIPQLAAEGISLVLYDLEPMNAPKGSISVQGDVRDAGLLTFAMQGCNAVIHAAALHGSLSETRNEDDFYSVNVTGTHNLLRAMLVHGVKALVFSSTDTVYGDALRDSRVIDEFVPCAPTRLHALTKYLGEELCQFYAKLHGFNIAILRYGNFEPLDWKAAGMGRLRGHLDRDDVAQANQLALGAVIAGDISCEPFLIHCAKPFIDADWPMLEEDPGSVLERYYPGVEALLAANELHIPTIHTRYDISRAVTVLGYDPQHNFEQFLQKLRSQP